ncbi:DUF2236 domain-containing protein [Salinibacterium sp. dk2585]|uniref:oxygenase MpaB family protein n=1 Tax=unclassified Salinibacterium TaxID=2632331 RepID=UPI0011C252ED|nr:MULTISPECIES: oxygenase MpaB family protein [unclassified Salinibacterium]QEE61054.1 DUF2236 domain-containing protein [Salinibacterium sp. dk2585]TXK52996.1 DUF2236 domain-containing protein [Salinibacterium sp. dk5596]
MDASNAANDGAGLHDGVGLLAAGANVIMQLSMLPVGRGVAESRVESGRVDRHPFKRARTTLTYLAVATGGTEDDRQRLRREINRVHAQVRSRPGDEVAYDAFDERLQLWVAACLYWGMEDVAVKMHGPLGDRAEDFYRRGAVLGTTLQVPAEAWPDGREAFERYWQHGIASIRMDDVTRAYLRGIADATFLPFPLDRTAGPLNRFLTLGFLPEQFRTELGLPWSGRQQRRFDRLIRVVAAVNRRMPRALREFPFNVLLRDARRRWRRGIAVV